MDAEVSSRIGAEYGERCPERVTQRNGYRSRAWDTRVGTMKLPSRSSERGATSRACWKPRRRSERALLAVIQQAYVEGDPRGRPGQGRVSQEPGVAHLSGATWWWMASWPSAGGGPYPYLWLDARPRRSGRTRIDQRLVVATAVAIIGMDVPVKTAPSGWPSYARCPPGASVGEGAGGIGRSSGTPRPAIAACLRRSQLATVPHPLHDQPAHSGPQARPALGGHHGPHHLPG